MCQIEFNLPAYICGGIVGATRWLELRVGVGKGADAETVIAKMMGI